MSGRRTAALLAAATFLLGGCGSAAQAPSAADRVPRLESLLKRLDADLAAHHYAAARADLQALKAAVAKARAAGQLDDAEAGRVLDAATQVLTALPASSATHSAAPSTPQATSSSGPSRPSDSAKAKPSRPRSTATTGSTAPTASPTGSSSPTAAPTSTSSPTASTSPTTQASPAAATSSPSP